MISAIVLTYNSEDNIRRCLESIKGLDEIIVIDSHSSDNTVKIAEESGAKVVQRDYPGYSEQLEYGISIAKNEWIFVIDSDEEATPELIKEINSISNNPDDNIDGYTVPRRFIFLGKFIEHGGWYPDHQYRFFRKDRSVPDHKEVHGAYQPKGHSGKLKGDIIHYSYRNLFDYVSRINVYTSLETSNKLNGNGSNNTKKVKWYNMLINPIPVFLKMFFLRKGYKDGMHGFILSIFSAMNNSILYAKLWEYGNSEKHGYEKPPITNEELNEFRKRGDN